MTKNRTPTPVYLDPGMHPGLEVKGLISTREEVDIPLELHWLHSPSADVVVFFKDTYALMLLLAHYPDVHQKKILTAWNLHV